MKKILLIEDTLQLAEEISDVLELEQFEVLIANHGKSAMEMVDNFNPDIIVTDLLMPVMDGFEFIRDYREKYGMGIPIIILSAKISDEDHEKGINLGAQQFLRKPCKVHELIEEINKLIS